MAFNELNSVAHYIIHQLSGVNCHSCFSRKLSLSPIAIRDKEVGYIVLQSIYT